jgi:hypothetical protein
MDYDYAFWACIWAITLGGYSIFYAFYYGHPQPFVLAICIGTIIFCLWTLYQKYRKEVLNRRKK